jgi:hypothetical protein
MTAVLIVNLASAYLAVGAVCALLFAGLVQRLEPSARGSSLLFRLLIVPGATLLWPVIARRCVHAWRRRTA